MSDDVFVTLCHCPTSKYLQDLEASCSALDDSVMARLAYSFLTCHLQQHRRRVTVCAEGSDVER